jgi:hypothetical protein
MKTVNLRSSAITVMGAPTPDSKSVLANGFHVKDQSKEWKNSFHREAGS